MGQLLHLIAKKEACVHLPLCAVPNAMVIVVVDLYSTESVMHYSVSS